MTATVISFDDYKVKYVRTMRMLLNQHEDRDALVESAFLAYVHRNPLASNLFWARIRRASQFIQKHGPYWQTLDFASIEARL